MAISFVNETNSDKQRPQITSAEGVNGSIKVNESTIEIIRKGLNNKLLGLHGNKEILIKSITSIQYKEPGFLTNGFIQFAFSGSKESKGGVIDAVKDENSIVFTKKQSKDFLQIKNLINQKRQENHNIPSSTSVPGIADLEKLAELRDKKIITEEEFVAKKKQILGL